jgi:hypothetical protein
MLLKFFIIGWWWFNFVNIPKLQPLTGCQVSTICKVWLLLING